MAYCKQRVVNSSRNYARDLLTQISDPAAQKLIR